MKYMQDKVCGYRLGSLPEAAIPELASISRIAAAEGMVLLENSKKTLPFVAGDKVAVFGRSQVEYCKSGTGSGGLVKVTYVTNILESLRQHGGITIDEDLAQVYTDWLVEHPFDKGKGWAGEPWAQVEMPVSLELAKTAAEKNDKALVIICRTAGEDKDNSATAGSWYLTETEEEMIASVTTAFERVCVVLNVGNIMDMSWVEKYGVDAVLYAWQGGMEGGRATVDVLCGDVTPCGKLTDTIARAIEDYPSHANFGSDTANIYQEDIYVGYRYFETFAPEKILYPFGFGLSYTTFSVETKKVVMKATKSGAAQVQVTVKVTNTGDYAGKEVVQVYLSAPQGKLGKAERELAAFAKTDVLAPKKSCVMKLSFFLDDFASYDDGGVTGHKSAYVLEAGQYLVSVGTDSHSAEAQAAFHLEEQVVEQCEEALAPICAFERMRPDAEGKVTYEAVPTRTYDLSARMAERRPDDIPYTGDQGIKLVDVRDGRATMEAFIAQLSDSELLEITRGEGMSSPKVTPGTGGCLGGVTEGLAGYGIPIACVTDGPSGLRLDSGLYATSLPNGTLLACSWNLPLIYQLFLLEGVEMTAYKIDCLLGPGINIHRHPLNGRNFEYFSEDPLLTGYVAAAMCEAVDESNVSCTIKHFMGNNQEWKRHEVDTIVSERAAREIYLRPFEIAVKMSGVRAIMTSYNFVNGLHAASCYDLTTTILRGEWGYEGYVMTDWWANMNEEGGKSSVRNLSLMIRAWNDVFMVDSDSATRQDDGKAALEEGRLTRGEVQRCAMTLCNYLMHTHAMERLVVNGSEFAKPETFDLSTMECVYTLEDTQRWKTYPMTVKESGKYAMSITYHADGPALAQIPISIIVSGHKVGFLMVKATEGATVEVTVPVTLEAGEKEIKFVTTSDALKIDLVKLYH